jgi:hypothetical protein
MTGHSLSTSQITDKTKDKHPYRHNKYRALKFPSRRNLLHIKEDLTANKPVQILCFWTLFMFLSLSKTLPCLYYKTQRFGDWILFPCLGKTYWAQATELVPISGHLYQHRDGVYKPSTTQTICKS